jgi:hypothetical protein
MRRRFFAIALLAPSFSFAEPVYAPDARAAAAYLTEAAKLVPSVIHSGAQTVAKQGIGAFLLDQQPSKELVSLNTYAVKGMIHLSEALRKDMTRTAKDAMPPR